LTKTSACDILLLDKAELVYLKISSKLAAVSKGKPAERRGRKTTDLQLTSHDRRVADCQV